MITFENKVVQHLFGSANGINSKLSCVINISIQIKHKCYTPNTILSELNQDKTTHTNYYRDTRQKCDAGKRI